jgi:hypothetical protein
MNLGSENMKLGPKFEEIKNQELSERERLRIDTLIVS